MPSHWGHKQLISCRSPARPEHSVSRRSAALKRRCSTRDSPPSRDRESQFHRDEVTYVSVGEGATSEGEFWESLNSACLGRLPVVYLVEDNGYAISVPVEVQTAGGDISRLVSSFPGPSGPEHRRHRLPCQLPGDDGGDRLRARAQGTGARPREGHPSVLALAVGRREAVQDAGRACRRSDARSDRRARRTSQGRGPRHAKRSSHAIASRRRSRGQRRGRARGAGARSPRQTRSVSTSFRRTSIRRPTRSPLRPRPKASPTRWSRRSTAPSRTRWRATRGSSSSAKTSPTAAARTR